MFAKKTSLPPAPPTTVEEKSMTVGTLTVVLKANPDGTMVLAMTTAKHAKIRGIKLGIIPIPVSKLIVPAGSSVVITLE